MVARVLGNGTRIVSAVELSDGKYNSTFRIDLGADGPAILRVAPEPGRQLRIEPELMRNEYASLPYLAGIAPLLPRVLGVDFTHAVLGRDFMIESWLPGVPAPAGLPRYPESLWPGYFEQIGGGRAPSTRYRGRDSGESPVHYSPPGVTRCSTGSIAPQPIPPMSDSTPATSRR